MSPRHLPSLIGSAATVLLLAGCAYGGGHDGYRAADYDGYYDNYYGPISDGYWERDGVFRFQAGPGHLYQRDDVHHIRRAASPGLVNIHGRHSDNPKVSDAPPRLTRAGRPPTDPSPPNVRPESH